MNCKQGDLAIIVQSDAGNEGKIVRCVKYLGAFLYWGSGDDLIDTWETDVALPSTTGELGYDVRDCQLRPLRGDLLNDEITHSKELESA